MLTAVSHSHVINVHNYASHHHINYLHTSYMGHFFSLYIASVVCIKLLSFSCYNRIVQNLEMNIMNIQEFWHFAALLQTSPHILWLYFFSCLALCRNSIFCTIVCFSFICQPGSLCLIFIQMFVYSAI